MSLLRWKIGRNVTTLVVGHEEDDDDDGVFSRSLSFSTRVFFFFVFPPSVRSLAWWIPWMGNSWRGSVDTTSCVIVFLFCAPWSLSALFHLTDEHFDEHRHYISQLVFVWFDFLCVCVCVICLTRGWQGMYQFKDELEEGQGKIGIDEANEIMKRKGPVDHLLLTFRN